MRTISFRSSAFKFVAMYHLYHPMNDFYKYQYQYRSTLSRKVAKLFQTIRTTKQQPKQQNKTALKSCLGCCLMFVLGVRIVGRCPS